MRFILNGQVTVGPARFWRIDDMEAMTAPGYDPLTFLKQPFALVNMTYTDEAAVRQLVEKLNAEVPV